MQDSYNLYVIIFNKPIEYQMFIATSTIETRMNLNILGHLQNYVFDV